MKSSIQDRIATLSIVNAAGLGFLKIVETLSASCLLLKSAIPNC
jgi:hypothetical protein